MHSAHSLTVISLGGGVQSSAQALMASQGAFGPIPDCAIFADTHWEPPSLYTHLDWLSEHLSFPVYIVDNGAEPPRGRQGPHQSLRQPQLRRPSPLSEGKGWSKRRHGAAAMHRALQNQTDSPQDTEVAGTHERTACSTRHRRRAVAGHLHRRGHPYEALPRQVDTEPLPLIEAGMSRRDCLERWQARYDRPLERSACIACPYQSRQRWVETKRRWPDLFAEAVEIDANLRGRLAFVKEPYLHPRRVPLTQAVMFDEAEPRDGLHPDGFGNECEGHCGV